MSQKRPLNSICDVKGVLRCLADFVPQHVQQLNKAGSIPSYNDGGIMLKAYIMKASTMAL